MPVIRTWINELSSRLSAPVLRRHRLAEKQRFAEASRLFEDVLVTEHEALFGDGEHTSRSCELDATDISDVQRLAEYLYEAHVKTSYDNYNINIGGDGPRISLRAKIWNGLSPDLQARLERFATKEVRTHDWDRDDKMLAREERETAALLSDALNAIIRGKTLTEEFVAVQKPDPSPRSG
jgi:hypothetical protein